MAVWWHVWSGVAWREVWAELCKFCKSYFDTAIQRLSVQVNELVDHVLRVQESEDFLLSCSLFSLKVFLCNGLCFWGSIKGIFVATVMRINHFVCSLVDCLLERLKWILLEFQVFKPESARLVVDFSEFIHDIHGPWHLILQSWRRGKIWGHGTVLLHNFTRLCILTRLSFNFSAALLIRQILTTAHNKITIFFRLGANIAFFLKLGIILVIKIVFGLKDADYFL